MSSRYEEMLTAIADGATIDEKCICRRETFLRAIANGDTSDLPEPICREEVLLTQIAERGIGSGGTPIVTENITVTPKTTQQTVSRSSGKYINKVTVEAVDNTIDSNIKAGNIKKDVTILGVTGTLESGSSGGSNGLQWKCDEMQSLRYEFYGYTGTSVEEPLSGLDTSSVTNMSYMFYNCTNLTSTPQLNTSNVTDMKYMFKGCTGLTNVSNLDTSNVTLMTNMFEGCTGLTNVSNLDISKATDIAYMFKGCTALEEVSNLDCSSLTATNSLYYPFNGCSNLKKVTIKNWHNSGTNTFSSCKNTLEEVNILGIREDAAQPFYSLFMNCVNLKKVSFEGTVNTSLYGAFSGCTNLTDIIGLQTGTGVNSLEKTFQNCSSLETIPALDVSNATTLSNCFTGCTNLKSILMTGMSVSFDISASTRFEREDLVTILNNLATVTTTRTLTMGSDNLAKLTEADIAIATEKGWTLA